MLLAAPLATGLPPPPSQDIGQQAVCFPTTPNMSCTQIFAFGRVVHASKHPQPHPHKLAQHDNNKQRLSFGRITKERCHMHRQKEDPYQDKPAGAGYTHMWDDAI